MDTKTKHEKRYSRRELIILYLCVGYKTVGTLRQYVRYAEVRLYGATLAIYNG